MIKKYFSSIVKLDNYVLKNKIFQSIFSAMQDALPILAIDVYLRLFSNLFLTPNALFPVIFNVNGPIFKYQMLIAALDIGILMIFAASLTKKYLKYRGISENTLPILTNFLATYFLFTINTQSFVRNVSQYLVVTVLTIISSESYYQYHRLFKKNNNLFAVKFLIWSGFIFSLYFFLQPYVQETSLQLLISNMLSSNFFTTFLGLLIVGFFSPILYWLGLALPSELSSNQTTINAVVKNLDVILKNFHATLPYPENLYSVYSSFSLLGGIGNTLAISFLLLFMSSKQKQHLGMLSIIPSLFNNNQLLYFGLPLFLRPLMLVPMILSSIVGIAVGYIAIAIHLIKPAALIIPNNVPNLLAAFLGSDYFPSLIVVSVVFILTLLIYKPFIEVDTHEVENEK
ncbi:PTS sugar transporter subunit IIC [Leuconostoc litchii]|uniref:PTS sugar transporter subunit IIC n=2 Tax=Leuconostoc litchii TaxID=1981069 RepID=A0A652NE72_9LACO|nr:PTS sugar transporter subunit IIC [Leuconostoc litchii]